MAALTDTAAERTLNWSTGQSAVSPVTPLRVALLTQVGDDVTSGVEVTGGGYTRQTFFPTVAATDVNGVTSVKNAQLIRFNNMPAVTVVGFAIYDSATTPFRWFYATLSAPRTFSLGDPAEFAVGDLVITAD
jgi:hypothetical protein